ncbi:MAG: GAF domain-containing protein [Chitinophagaceae bacterium]|nr:MAG: GAF domain-containing protein [Chitinophagaceae bacterium]
MKKNGSKPKKNTPGREPIPENEAGRREALARYQLLEGLPAGYFNNLAHIVAQTFDAPVALVSLVQQNEVQFAGNAGMEETDTAPREISLCSLAICDASPTVIPNALEDPCTLSNPLVTGSFGLRFYAGAPILTGEGIALGTVCIVDREPRDFTDTECDMLKEFARTAMEEIEIRCRMLKQAEA